MPDYASIIGGDPDDTLPGDDVRPDQDAYYRIEAADVFIDRFDSSGDSIVDATGNPNSLRVALGSGEDVVFGGAGNDTVWTGAGNDVVWVEGGGNKVVSGGAGSDSVESGAGTDSVYGGSGGDTIHAGAGNDYAAGGSGADSMRGEAGDDSLYGGSGADSLYGGDGADMLVGGSGADLLMGGAGDDMMFGGSGRDVFAFDSGFGDDVINDLRPGDQINLASNLNGSGIASAADLVSMGMVTGGTTEAGTKFTLITIGGDTIRLERVDHTDFINQISNWVKVG